MSHDEVNGLGQSNSIERELKSRKIAPAIPRLLEKQFRIAKLKSIDGSYGDSNEVRQQSTVLKSDTTNRQILDNPIDEILDESFGSQRSYTPLDEIGGPKACTVSEGKIP